jgi:4-hydroxy-tetrahydrodipicolinate synthase
MFKGSGVALVTPFNNDQIDFSALEALIEWHIEQGSDALIILGTTGEGATLSTEEKMAVFSYALNVAKGRLFMVANTGSNDTRASIELSLRVKELGYDALLAVAPYYNKPSQRGLVAHFQALADAVEHPIILYNVPARTAVNLSAETTLELARHRYICGIKEASHDLDQIANLCAHKAPEFAVYSGNDDQNEAIFKLGGVGVISVTANVVPARVKALCTAALAGDFNQLARLSKGLEALNEGLFIESNPVPAKRALNLMGRMRADVRLPLVGLEAHNDARLSALLKAEGLL